MMGNLLLEEGGLLQVQSASLPVASYAKFQPQSVDFLDISNPKAVYPLQFCLSSDKHINRSLVIFCSASSTYVLFNIKCIII